MTTRRSYHDACAASHGLDLIGERWALLVVRELMLGPKRFTDLRSGLSGVSANVLTQRLTELEETAVVRRRKLPPPASAWIYELTEWGYELEPVIMALGRWAARSPGLMREVPMGADSLILSFRTMFDPAAAAGVRVCLVFHLGDDRFTAEVNDGTLRAERGSPERPDAVVTAADPTVIAGLVYGGQDLEAFIQAGAVQVTGDRAALERFTRLFPMPTPAPAA
ncbi:MAG: winged helix-turn-helix transcriptional regulator [Candidatus Sericytochromatia bacterium]